MIIFNKKNKIKKTKILFLLVCVGILIANFSAIIGGSNVEHSKMTLNSLFSVFDAHASVSESNPESGDELTDHLTDPDPCTYSCEEIISVCGIEIAVTKNAPGGLIECHSCPGQNCTPKVCSPTSVDPCSDDF